MSGKSSTEKMVYVPYSEYRELEEFRKNVDLKGVIVCDSYFGRTTSYYSSNEASIKLMEEIKDITKKRDELNFKFSVLNNQNKLLESRIGELVYEKCKLKKLSIMQFIKYKYFGKNEKQT